MPLHRANAFTRFRLWRSERWGERQKISFGGMLAKQTGGDEKSVRAIDEMVEADYRENR